MLESDCAGKGVEQLLLRVGIDPRRFSTLSEQEQRIALRMAERLSDARDLTDSS